MVASKTIGIVYFSGTGTTRALAEHVQRGVNDAGATPSMVEIVGTDIVEGRWSNDSLAGNLDGCDALIFGSPTYMGCVSAQLKSFFDAMAPRWYTQAWNGKFAGAFTASSLAAGDKLNCLQDISSFAMQMGMIWVGTGNKIGDNKNTNGFYLGVGATASSAAELTESDTSTAEHLGQRVALFTQQQTTVG